jgi:hypothetical protein
MTEGREKRATEAATKYLDRQEEVAGARQPGHPLPSEAASGDEAVHMRMMMALLTPRM